MSGAAAENGVGIECYATRGPPCPARAKSAVEDFHVEELIQTGEIMEEHRPGFYPIYRVEKRSIDTMHMAREIENRLKSRVSYGGLKDSRAVAIQFVTPVSLRSTRPPEISAERFTAKLIGYVQKPINRSSLVGNRFDVVLRNCCPEIGSRCGEAAEAAAERRIPNYFGLQRFGVGGAGTHRIGRAVVKGDFSGAVSLILDGYDAGRGGRGKDVESLVSGASRRGPEDPIRALRAVPLRLRRLYVQAYQAYLFNKTLSRALKDGIDISRYQRGDNWAETSGDGMAISRVRGVREAPTTNAVPMVQIPGYAYRDYGSRFDRCLEGVLEAEGVAPGQFYVKELQEVSAEGGFRRPHLTLSSFHQDPRGEEMRLSFTLAKGQYATVFLREIMKPDDPEASGLV